MIINGDCLEVLRKIPVGRVKTIFMDSPDNIGLTYNNYDDNLKPEHYYNWLHLLLLEAMPKCQILWISHYYSHILELNWLIRDIIKYRHPSFSFDQFLWTYTFSQYNDKDCANGYRPMIRLMRRDAKIYPNEIRELSKRQLIGDARAAGDRVPDNVWRIPRVVGNALERVDFIGTQHPIALMEKIIKFTCNANELFVDCFGGSGSALRAGKKCGRNVIIVEKDPATCEKINNLPELKSCKLVKFDDSFDWEKTTNGKEI